MSSVVRGVAIVGLVLGLGALGLGWWGLPILLGVVAAEAWISGGPEVRDGFARRLLAFIPFAGAVLAVFLIANRLFDGSAVFYAWMGTIFAFWLVVCVILPARRGHRLKPQR